MNGTYGIRTPRILTRRQVLFTGGSVLGIAVLGSVTACSGATSEDPAAGTDPSAATPAQEPGSAGDGDGLSWRQASMDFVSAYVLIRGREAAVVDTGTSTSDAVQVISSALGTVELDWDAVRHIVLTHQHGDHAGGLPEVAASAASATLYAGQADLSAIATPQGRTLTPADDGAEVFGMQVIGTPGHTAGHICVFDPTTRVLVAGDALRTTAGLQGSDPQYTADQAAAVASVKKLATLDVSAILPGHGPPLTSNAADALSTLAESLA